MAEQKKSFIFYCDWKDTFDQLPNDKAGELIKFLLAYVNDENPETDDILINAVFANIKNSLKRDLLKYRETKDGLSKSGIIGNLKRWHTDLYKKYVLDEITLDEALKIAKGRNPSPPDKSESPPIAKIAVSANGSVTETVIDNEEDKKEPPKPEPPVNSFSTEVEETYSQILHFFPNKLHPDNNVRVIRWKTEIERLNRLDKNSFSKIVAVVKWARDNKFWKKQFLSMMKLRTLIKNQDVQVFKYMVIQMEDNTDNGELKTYTYGDMTAKNDIDKGIFKEYTSIKLLNGEIAWVKNEDIEKFNLKKQEQ